MTRQQKTHCLDILEWYYANGRALPWRKTHKPYRVLVSEIMLQQTQVSRVIDKYKAFLKAFPTAKALADAQSAEVITAWKGLGYNRRALFLQRTAQVVRAEYNGRFPQTLDALKALPGIGDYTARAILSFAFDQPTPVLDTNHRKFYQKTFFGDALQTDAVLLAQAQEVITSLRAQERADQHPSIVWHWNQALMDWVSAHPGDYMLPKKKKKKASVPFRQTDRYYRGRIIDLLREEGSTTHAMLEKQFSDIPKERMSLILNRLEKDTLIKRHKQRILLP